MAPKSDLYGHSPYRLELSNSIERYDLLNVSRNMIGLDANVIQFFENILKRRATIRQQKKLNPCA